MSDIFRFKQFAIDQRNCAMRINTDGVLLGAVATASAPQRILDVGTGTGVIALMLAQRFVDARVDAIDIDALSATAASNNFAQSPFAERLIGHARSLQEYDATESYDLIVSNPPFFIHSLKNPDARKQQARHTDWAFFEMLLQRTGQWLSPVGSLQLVLPSQLAGELIETARSFGLYVQWQMNIRSFVADLDPVRKIIALGRESDIESTTKDFVIYERKGEYSLAYRELLRDFFLAF